jgi:regulator of protease activity HflC (stomatin/prohibitin superfamily)
MNNLTQSITSISGGIIKNTIAKFTFQELLGKREEISKDIEMQIDPIAHHWGVDIDKIFLKGKN